jgi:hypothetical protein
MALTDKDIKILTPHQYDILTPQERQNKIVLNIDDKKYIDYISNKFESSNSKIIRKIQRDYGLGYQNFITIVGRGQSGKSVAGLNLLIWRNQTIDIKQYIAYSMIEYLNKNTGNLKKYIMLEEAQRVMRSHSTAKLQEIGNIFIDFFQTDPYLQNSTIITEPSIRLLAILKSHITLLFSAIARGVFNIYVPRWHINSNRILWKNTKERLYTYPLSQSLYNMYETLSYASKQDLLNEDKQTIKTLLNTDNPFV